MQRFREIVKGSLHLVFSFLDFVIRIGEGACFGERNSRQMIHV